MMKRTLLVFFLVFLCCGELIKVKLSQNQEDPAIVGTHLGLDRPNCPKNVNFLLLVRR